MVAELYKWSVLCTACQLRNAYLVNYHSRIRARSALPRRQTNKLPLLIYCLPTPAGRDFGLGGAPGSRPSLS